MAAMAPTRDDLPRLLAEYASQPKPSGPVTLSDPYLKAVESWDSLPENAERTDKGWVLMDSARLLEARLDFEPGLHALDLAQLGLDRVEVAAAREPVAIPPKRPA